MAIPAGLPEARKGDLIDLSGDGSRPVLLLVAEVDRPGQGTIRITAVPADRAPGLRPA